MPGLFFQTGLHGGAGAGGSVSTVPPPSGASAVAEAAYGPGGTTRPSGGLSKLSPLKSQGLAFWMAVGGLVGLVIIRQSLPR
jgi:hypothetical protein